MPIRPLAILIAAILVLTASPALAGKVVLVNGKSSWTSTQCTAPAMPSGYPKDPETPANDLNARINAYNAFAAAAQAYMNCLAAEGGRDAGSFGKAITDEAQAAIDSEQKQVLMLRVSLQDNTPAR